MTGGTAPAAASRKHLHEWPFWCLLATRAAAASEADVPALLSELTGHAGRQALPVTYEAGKGTLWATVCRLFILFRVNGKDAGRIGYMHAVFGIGRAFRSPRFAKIAFGKINTLVLSPSHPERTFRESVADAFLANGATRTTPLRAPDLERSILKASMDDPAALAAAVRAVAPPPDLWDAAVAEYYQRRAGYLRTMFSSAKRWRADMEEVTAGRPGA
jgi:hypothetical protein